MRIYRIAINATDLETVYEGLKKALLHLGRNHIGKTKNELKKALKDLERVRPHLKYKGRPVRRKY